MWKQNQDQQQREWKVRGKGGRELDQGRGGGLMMIEKRREERRSWGGKEELGRK